MFRALLLATGDLFAPRILTLVVRCVVASLGVFLALWWGVAAACHALVSDLGSWSPYLAGLGGGLVAFFAAWFLLPAVLGLFVGLVLEPVAVAVEAIHHPGLGKAPGQSLVSSLRMAMRSLALLLVVNVALLVLLVVAPVGWPVAWVVLNGWLLGGEFFDAAGARRLPVADLGALRRRVRGETFVLGVVIALGAAVPFVNLLLPVWATALFVHRHAAWRQAGGG